MVDYDNLTLVDKNGQPFTPERNEELVGTRVLIQNDEGDYELFLIASVTPTSDPLKVRITVEPPQVWTAG